MQVFEDLSDEEGAAWLKERMDEYLRVLVERNSESWCAYADELCRKRGIGEDSEAFVIDAVSQFVFKQLLLYNPARQKAKWYVTGIISNLFAKRQKPRKKKSPERSVKIASRINLPAKRKAIAVDELAVDNPWRVLPLIFGLTELQFPVLMTQYGLWYAHCADHREGEKWARSLDHNQYAGRLRNAKQRIRRLLPVFEEQKDHKKWIDKAIDYVREGVKVEGLRISNWTGPLPALSLVAEFLKHTGESDRVLTEYLVSAAQQLDKKSDRPLALQLGKLALSRVDQDTAAWLECTIYTELAIMLDHEAESVEGMVEQSMPDAEQLTRLKKALGLLEEGAEHLEHVACRRADYFRAECPDQFYRAVLQRGILARRRAEVMAKMPGHAPKASDWLHLIRFAEKQFLSIIAPDSPAADDHRTLSAPHQLGVLELVRGRYLKAENRFRRCIAEYKHTEKKGKKYERRVHDYRRLAYVLVKQTKLQEAVEVYIETIDICREEGFFRYLGRTMRDIHELNCSGELSTELMDEIVTGTDLN